MDYYNSGYEEKGLYDVNLEKSDENNDEVTFSVETVTGNKGIDPWPFSPDDHWWYGEDEGGCAGNNATSSDAAHELTAAYLTYDLTECMAIAGPCFVEVIGGEEWLRRPNDPMDNHYDYYIFCVKDNVEPFNYDDDLCLMAEKMPTYYWFLDYVIQDLAREYGNIPENDVFINFNYNEGYSVYNSTPPVYTKYIHHFELMYGLPFEKPNCDPPIEL